MSAKLECIDCGSRLFVEYGNGLLSCEDCGQMFDIEKDFKDAPADNSERQAIG